MKVKIKETREFKVSYINCSIGARHWEDSKVNGVKDVDGTLIPCRSGDYWCPIINVDTGVITNWDKDNKAEIHYKSCDDNYFEFLDEGFNVIATKEGYVPDFMCPKEEGYGDCVIMDIDENGKIANWSIEDVDITEEED